MSWLSENIGTLVIVFVLAAVVALIVKHMKKDKAQGKSSCGCNCAHCALHGTCHSANAKGVKKK